MIGTARRAADLPPPPADLLERASLFVDFDGTLVDFAPHPDQVRVDDALRDLLVRLAAYLGGRLAVISGRPLDQLARLLSPLMLPLVGSHGLEWRLPDGREIRPPADPALDGAVERARVFATTHGLGLEVNPYGVALHSRLVPDKAEAASDFFATLAATTGLSLQHGARVSELCTPGGDKGSGLRRMMREPLFALGRPVMVGDDLTDEHGFGAANADGGSSVHVGQSGQTLAQFAVPSVERLHQWLTSILNPGSTAR